MPEQRRRAEPPPAPLEQGVQKLLKPFDLFVRSQTSAGILLILSAAAAMILANSPLREMYEQLGHVPIRIGAGDATIEYSLHHWVNDGLMVLFFFILGLEIKRELLAGELRDLRQSVLVLIMALGGMLAPALIYVALVGSDIGLRGWGIPMATDTAFAVGALALMGSRVPRATVVLLAALAIVDDIGAVLVISLFYTGDIAVDALMAAGGVFLVMIGFNLMGVRRAIFYLIGGLLLWWFVQRSGIHPTTAGILAAMTVPARPYAGKGWFKRRITTLLRFFERVDSRDHAILERDIEHDVVEEMQDLAKKTTTPLQHWQSMLDRPVNLGIVPLFAFLNAGVAVGGELENLIGGRVFWGTAAGLVLGKGLGISLFAWLALRFGWARLPPQLQLAHVVGLGLLAGMGFTMSLFISALAFADHPALAAQAKLGILAGSALAGMLGMAILYGASRRE